MKKLTILLAAFYLLGCKSIIETTKIKPDISCVGFYYLPIGVIKLDVIKIVKDGKTDYRLNYHPQIIPDISQKYYIKYAQSFNSNDNIHFELESKNFIKKVKVESEDVADELIIKISELASQAIKVSTVFPGDTIEASIDTIKTLYYGVNQQNDEINKELQKYNMRINVKKLSFSEKTNKTSYSKNNFQGILYRPSIPYLIEINNNKNELINSKKVYLPDDDIVEFDISRASFVKKVTEIDFENGSLSKFTINKPSQSLEIVSVPIEILKSIVALPTDLIQLKIDLSSKNKELILAQQEELKAKNELIELLKSLEQNSDSNNINTGAAF